MRLRPLLASLLVLLLSFSVRAELKRDVVFARVGELELTLDAHVPEGTGPFPTAILVHGGGFIKGDKNTYITPLFEPLSDANYTWFTINYRLAPQHRWPACLEDVESAIRWVRAHAVEYKVDVNRIALIGESAGGHLVSMAGIRSHGDTAVAAVVPFYAPHNLHGRAERTRVIRLGLAQVFGISQEVTAENLEVLRKGSPYHHLKSGLPPYLLIHGDEDTTVTFDQSTSFREASVKLGNVCELITIPGGAHGMGGWKAAPGGATYADEMIAWLNKVMPAK
jgi:acetyl esterase